MSAETQPETPPEFPVPLLAPGQLAAPSCDVHGWLWYGYLGPGMITTFTSQGKSGKTTLAAILLARLKLGGQLAGLPLSAGKAIVASEESRQIWDARCRHLGIGEDHVRFLCRPFRGARPTTAQWIAFVANLARLHRQERFDLLVIDPLAGFLPGSAETYAPAMLDFLLPLQELAEAGTAVWLLHHPARGKRPDGQAGRGTSALAGFADVLIEMSCVKRLSSTDRRRRLRAYSRKDETPRLVIELNAAGTDYVIHAAGADGPTIPGWPEVQAILAGAYAKMTHHEIVTQWPEDRDPPKRSTLYRQLRAATQEGLVCCDGTGARGDPYRYWLAERAPLLQPGPGASEEEMQAWNDRLVKEVWEHIDRHQAAQRRPPEGSSP
jgi:hypothetical protein